MPTLPSSTTLAIERLDAGHYDTYESGTARERGYLNSRFVFDEADGDGDISRLQVQEIEVRPEKDSQDAPFEWDDE